MNLTQRQCETVLGGAIGVVRARVGLHRARRVVRAVAGRRFPRQSDFRYISVVGTVFEVLQRRHGGAAARAIEAWADDDARWNRG
jgi:hypothetical protein